MTSTTNCTRIDEECSQLLVDIVRVGTPDQPHVTFGQLFEDPAVEQYYEALVGTLKSAKKRGLIHFQGQFLLKGVHDSTVISIVGAGGTNSLPSAAPQDQQPAPLRKWKRPAVLPTQNPVPPKQTSVRSWQKPVKKEEFKADSNFSTPTSSSAYHLRGFTNTSSKNASHRRKQHAANSCVSIYHNSGSENVLNKSFLPPPALVVSQAMSSAEACHDRHEQELRQLLVDIRRVSGGCDQVCFGELFDDPQVEQYYEALVGTLKSAKRRGLINFKGQMLLKGMHDKVLIQIASETQ